MHSANKRQEIKTNPTKGTYRQIHNDRDFSSSLIDKVIDRTRRKSAEI